MTQPAFDDEDVGRKAPTTLTIINSVDPYRFGNDS
jgi:hypothetical protein